MGNQSFDERFLRARGRTGNEAQKNIQGSTSAMSKTTVKCRCYLWFSPNKLFTFNHSVLIIRSCTNWTQPRFEAKRGWCACSLAFSTFPKLTNASSCTRKAELEFQSRACPTEFVFSECLYVPIPIAKPTLKTRNLQSSQNMHTHRKTNSAAGTIR